MWERQVAAFAKHFDVIRPDVRGFGGSELPPQRWSPVEDLLTLMNELQLKPAHLVGCSFGSMIAIDFALEHPERVSKLVLVGPGIGGANFGQRHPEVFAEVRAPRTRPAISMRSTWPKCTSSSTARDVRTVT